MLKGPVKWERYWVPLGVAISTEPGGFLFDPKGLFQPASGSLKTLGELWDFPFVVLCGEPASGKSTLLEFYGQSFKQDSDKVRQFLMIDFRTVLDAADFLDQLDRSDIWQQWRSGNYPLHVVIDGVDEGVLKIGDFLPRLVQILTQLDPAARGRLHLKLVCRTLEWTRYQDSEHQIALLLTRNAADSAESESTERPVYTLCPLTRAAITLAVQESALDPEGFFTAIFDTGVTELAAYPFTLKMLLREFGSGQIHSQTRRMLYENYARALCNEYYESLRRTLPALQAYLIPRSERLFLAAELLAAVMIVTGRDSVQLNSSEPAPDLCLRLEDILRVAETIDSVEGAKVSQSELQSALSTAIFTDRGADRFGFVHRTMAECLSARRYAGMELRRLRPLFFQGPATDRHVIPQLAQTASWLCKDHPQFFEAVLECDVEVLLRTEASRISDNHRERIVTLLLQRAKSGKLGFDTPLYLAGLKYAGLSQQLSRVLINPASEDAERALAVSIAQECEVQDLSATLFALLESAETRAFMLPRIADALIAIHKGKPESLLTLLKPGILARDTDFRVRGKALDALVPGTLSVQESFKYLETPGENAINAYSFFLSNKLPTLISRELIPAFLHFLASKDSWATLGSFFRSLGERVFAVALSHLDDPEIADLTAAEWIRVLGSTYGWSLSGTPQISDVLAGSPDIRQKLAAAVIKLLSQRASLNPASASFLWVGLFPILREDDLLWLLDFLTHCSGNQFTVAGSIFVTGFRWFGFSFFAKHSETIIKAYNEVPEIKRLLHDDIRAWDLDEPLSQKAKSPYQLEADLKSKFQKQKDEQIPWPTAVKIVLERLSTDSMYWLEVCKYLTFDGDWKPSPLSAENDIPVGWSHLSVTEKTLALAGGRKFLIEHESHLTEHGKTTNYSIAGYTAAVLLVDQIERDTELAAAFYEKWIQTVIQHWPSNGTASKRALLGLCRRLDPAQTLNLLRETILHEATTDPGALLATDGVEEIADEEVLAMLWECATAPDVKSEAIRHLVRFLTKNRWNWFKIQLNEVTNGNISLQTEKRVAVLATVFRLRTVESWDMIRPALQIDAELARSILVDLAYHHQYNSESGIHQVSESKLIDLYRKLAELYPIGDDPPFRAGSRLDDPQPQETLPRERVAEFRQEIPRILGARDSQSGCDALKLLASEFEQSRSQIQWCLRQSTERWRMKAWNPPTIADVTRLLLDPKAQLVTASDGLLEVVIESLRRLQSRITDTANPLVDDFWFIGKLGNTARNYGPHSEEHVARRIAAWLQDDLQSRHPTVINREAVPRPGQRTDITVEAPLRSRNETLVPKVIIEIKGNWHPDVRTACGTQLVNTYLQNQPNAAGIYLLAWFGAGNLPGEDNSRCNGCSFSKMM